MENNGRHALLVIVVHGAIVVVGIAAATTLTALGKMGVDVTEGYIGAALAWGGAVSSGVVRRSVPKLGEHEHVMIVPATPEHGP